MKISDNGINLIKSFEGLELTAYLDVVGIPTIGFGHTKTVTKADVQNKKTINQNQAVLLLLQDLATYEQAVNKLVKVPLTQNQYDALVSLVYNIGETNFKKSSLLVALNNNNYNLAADKFLQWNKGGRPLRAIKGLTIRRNKERDLFLK